MKFGLSNSLYDAALEAHSNGLYADAETGYKKALVVEPNHFQSLFMLGMLAGQHAFHDIALSYTDQALTVNPSAPEAHYNRAMALVGLLRDDEAILAFQKAIELKPDFTEASQSLRELQDALKAKAAANDAAPPA
jgi:tetratricopeptide (TPR) repeat protein